MRLTFRVEHSHVDGERSYCSTVDLGDKTTMEAIEAHARAMIKILAHQASADCDPDESDEDEGDEWKRTVGHS